MWPFKKPERPIAVKYKRHSSKFEDLCQRVDIATDDKQLAWVECKRPGRWWAEAELHSGRFKVMFMRGGYGVDFKIGLARVGEASVLISVELRNDFGEALYDEIRRQVYGPIWAKDEADLAAAVLEARRL